MATAMEVRFARKLASNDGRTRRRTFKALTSWLEARSQRKDGGLSHVEMLKVWKGLYVCMWHSDKPLLQEELAEDIAVLIHGLSHRESALLFLKCFFVTMAREWHGIDRLRLDKYYMLIRRVIHHSFKLLRTCDWETSFVQGVAEVYADGVLCPNSDEICSGVQLHAVEVYLPELLTVGGHQVPGECASALLQPCLTLLAQTRDKTIADAVRVSVLEGLIRGTKAKALQVNLEQLSEKVLQLAIDRKTVGANRKSLYSFRRKLAEHMEPEPLAAETAKRPKHRP